MKDSTKTTLIIIGELILLFLIYLNHTAFFYDQGLKTNQITSYTPLPKTKTANCQIQNSLPDPKCTPGAVLNVTKEQICTKGYSKTVRNVSESTKKLVYKNYNIIPTQKGEYEIDHFISLELGGSNDIANLWPEAASPKPGFHEKDKVENYLHTKVCSGELTLAQAQKDISVDWPKTYEEIQPPNPLYEFYKFISNIWQQ